MVTLSNVYLHGEVSPNCIGEETNTIPEAVSSKTGESVSFALSPEHHWFVFRASYGRSIKAADYLISDGTYAYVAKRYAIRHSQGKKRRVLEPIIPNILFAYTTPKKAEEYVKETPKLSFLSFYYNHFKHIGHQKNPPLTIPDHEMKNFIHATACHSEHIALVEPIRCHFKGGDIVRVIDGAFKGVEGRVARVHGQQRVVVSLSHVGLIATAYIPSAFLQKIEQ